MPTPHIDAQPGDFADTVLMPGDPLRARYIAENYLGSPRLVNSVRNMLGYTGHYQGREISVMGSGMGIPSISIYACELYTHFEVQSIIRIGSCGAVQEDVALYDLVVAQTASTDSSVNCHRFRHLNFAPCADYQLMQKVISVAQQQNARVHVGNVFSADSFYSNDADHIPLLTRAGILAAEMEAAGLYGMAAEHKKRALAVNTVSDHLLTGERLTAAERENTFDSMIEVVLQSCLI